ncbi:MAG: enoyl-CoA hydratase/isomerase family protein [Enterovirga sp.]|jgi:enoyl-CoA hydratase/carnithine racemase|nr:enoyl-CoA hydratase/isomerase family protein [Enterovirga sp.]
MQRDHDPDVFRLEKREDGIGLVTFDRPPVNAVSRLVYEQLGRLADRISASDIRCVVLTAPPGARAWCGGADLKDFVGMDPEGRKERYALINDQVQRFYQLDRPVIAAINAHAIGIGMILAGLCDMRIAAEDAGFSCPEIDYGLVGGGAGLFAQLGMPEAKIREMLFTGRRLSATELLPTGFFNAVVPRERVLDTALDLAAAIARKSLPAIKARKLCSTAIGGLDWFSAYLIAQEHSAALAAGRDGQEGVRAFLDGREALYGDA